MSYAALVVGAVGTGYKIYDSARKNSQAKKLAATNKRPVFNADGSIAEIKEMAASEINNGVVQDYGTRQLEQGQASGIDAILKSGGKADFGTIHGQYGNALQGLIASVNRERSAKLAAYSNAAYNYSQSRDAEFSYNQDAPFKDLKQQEALLRTQSEQSKMDAIKGAATTAANYGLSELSPGEEEKRQERRDARRENRNQIKEEQKRRTDIAGIEPGAPLTRRPGLNTDFDYSDYDNPNRWKV